MSADSAAARREARRAKILAKGNERLNKLTSTYNGTTVEPAEEAGSGEGVPGNVNTIEGGSGGGEENAAAATTPIGKSNPTIRPAEHFPAQSPAESHLRQRLATQSTSSFQQPQSPSVARTPVRQTQPSVAAPIAPSPLLSGFDMEDDVDGTGAEMMAELQRRMAAAMGGAGGPFSGALAPSIHSGSDEAGAAVAAGGLDQQEIVQNTRVETAFRYFRRLSMLLLALFTMFHLVTASEYWEDYDDTVGLSEWKVWTRRAGSLTQKATAEGFAGVTAERGVLTWVNFLTVEIGLQGIGYLIKQVGSSIGTP
ncbi:uncharacterized protein EV422DRAFT_598886 [Fimicolochytrium jonesii]|uniref:uncharacterized protein n=1 Tax=Fimicolochytrium jonesii TaxID=1396493 RepID=UPI0022FE651C|nr:uncharacterized protein EV422DRAFT_598886 [Fimicolochytrium jonesii]KAI8819452.1 hypothetical protein EV422DRAFT_598886 [Fimicolochytrium jonesii]